MSGAALPSAIFDIEVDHVDEATEALLRPGAALHDLGPGRRHGSRRLRIEVPHHAAADTAALVNAYGHREFRRRQMRPGAYAFDGAVFRASRGVYQPDATSSSRLFWNALNSDGLLGPGLGRLDPARALDVLDMGCGAGLLAIQWARKRPLDAVLGVDIGRAAVRDARHNARRNVRGAARSVPAFRQSDLFARVDGAFHVILFNYPFWQGEEHRRALVDRVGIDPGGALLRRFFDRLGAALHPGGQLYLGYSSLADVGLLHALCEGARLRGEAAWREPDAGRPFHRTVWRIVKA